MKIVVCVKHVPSDQSRRRIEGGRLVRGEEDGLNELDENAIEAAVQLAAAQNEAEPGSAEVIALTMGPAGAVAAVRRALQAGADRGVLVSDERAAGSDVVATARILAAAIRTIDAENPETGDVGIVVTGLTAGDGLTSLLPSALAAALGVPALTSATELGLADGRLEGTRGVPTAVDRVSVALPAVVAVTDQANTPRPPNMRALLAAKKKPVATVSLDDIGVGEMPTRVRVVDAHEVPPRQPGEIVTDTGDAGRRFAAWLVEHDLVGERGAGA